MAKYSFFITRADKKMEIRFTDKSLLLLDFCPLLIYNI